jgi:hypothetical protein
MTFDTSDVRCWFPRFTPEAQKANQPGDPTVPVGFHQGS